MFSSKTRHIIVLLLSLVLAAYSFLLTIDRGLLSIPIAFGVFLVSWLILSITSGLILGLLGYDVSRKQPDVDQIIKLYERALTAANMYLPVKLGTGQAKIASAMLNEMMSDDVCTGNGVEAFRAENRTLLQNKAEQLLGSDHLLRQLIGHTLWVKWLIDNAHGHAVAVAELESGWCYKALSSDYPMPSLEQYEKLVTQFERHLEDELGKYLEAHSARA